MMPCQRNRLYLSVSLKPAHQFFYHAEKYVVAEEHVFVKEYIVTCSEFSDIFSLYALRIPYHFRYISQIKKYYNLEVGL